MSNNVEVFGIVASVVAIGVGIASKMIGYNTKDEIKCDEIKCDEIKCDDTKEEYNSMDMRNDLYSDTEDELQDKKNKKKHIKKLNFADNTSTHYIDLSGNDCKICDKTDDSKIDGKIDGKIDDIQYPNTPIFKNIKFLSKRKYGDFKPFSNLFSFTDFITERLYEMNIENTNEINSEIKKHVIQYNQMYSYQIQIETKIIPYIDVCESYDSTYRIFDPIIIEKKKILFNTHDLISNPDLINSKMSNKISSKLYRNLDDIKNGNFDNILWGNLNENITDVKKNTDDFIDTDNLCFPVQYNKQIDEINKAENSQSENEISQAENISQQSNNSSLLQDGILYDVNEINIKNINHKSTDDKS